jgi:hypothetical protein
VFIIQRFICVFSGILDWLDRRGELRS